MKLVFKIRETIWLYPGDAAWYFVSLDNEMSTEIKEIASGFARRGWGSVPVEVNAGGIDWQTSIFPDKSGVYLLPLKSEARKKLGVADGDVFKGEIRLRF